jgi:hypothetical protein
LANVDSSRIGMLEPGSNAISERSGQRRKQEEEMDSMEEGIQMDWR